MHYLCGKEMADIKDSNISNYDIHHYSNRTCFLINDDFDYMIAAKNPGEEALGWKVLPEIVYHVEKMCPKFRPSGDLHASFIHKKQ